MDPKREALLAAVNALATCDSPSREYERLQDAAPLAKRINALPHDFEVLRPPVELASRDPAAFDHVLNLISAFWATIDRELDELEEVTRAEMLNPSRKK